MTAHDATPTPGKPWWRRENSRAVFVGRPAEYRIVIKPEDECWAAREPEMEKISGTIASAPALAEENARLKRALETIHEEACEAVALIESVPEVTDHEGEKHRECDQALTDAVVLARNQRDIARAALAQKEPEDV